MPLTPIKVIDVTDPAYGAIGDGVADDTAKIQLAVNAYASFCTAPLDSSVAGVASYTGPVLYFPEGNYKITGQILLGDDHSGIRIVGDNANIIAGSTFDQFAFFHNRCYDVSVEGLNFINFKKALYLGNATIGVGSPHRDTSQWNVISCSFQKCGEALAILGTSARVNVEKCKFYYNVLAINIEGGDKIIVRDNWITSGFMSAAANHPAQIINRGTLTFDSNVLVPMPMEAGVIEPAWINNYESVRVNDVRQGGEPASFTLINNFAGSAPPISNRTPFTVSVKNSECYAVYGNNHPAGIIHPAVVRYVTKVPNSTIIKNNIGIVDSRIVDFSYDLYYKPGHSGNIDTMIINSEAVPQRTIVEVVNNVGGVMYDDHLSFVPLPLYPFIRSDESMWPSTRNTTTLEPIGAPDITSAPGYVIYKFAFENFNDTLLLKYSGNPQSGSSYYSGNYTGIIRSNGTFIGGDVHQALRLYPLSNELGSPGTFFHGTYNVSIYWDAAPQTDLLPATDPATFNPNRFFYVKIDQHAHSVDDYDRIKLIRLDRL